MDADDYEYADIIDVAVMRRCVGMDSGKMVVYPSAEVLLPYIHVQPPVLITHSSQVLPTPVTVTTSIATTNIS